MVSIFVPADSRASAETSLLFPFFERLVVRVVHVLIHLQILPVYKIITMLQITPNSLPINFICDSIIQLNVGPINESRLGHYWIDRTYVFAC